MEAKPIQSTESFSKDELSIAGVSYTSRLLVGTGKYKDLSETRAAILASGAEIVTAGTTCRFDQGMA